MATKGIMTKPKKGATASTKNVNEKPKRERKMVEIQPEFGPLLAIVRKRRALKTDTAVVNQAVREFLEREQLWPPPAE